MEYCTAGKLNEIQPDKISEILKIIKVQRQAKVSSIFGFMIYKTLK